MKNNLTTTNQNAKLALSKSKSLLDITNKLLSKKDISQLIQSFQFKPFLKEKEDPYGVFSVAISPDGKTIVSGSGDIKIWDMQSGKCINTLDRYCFFSVSSVAISPDGKIVVSGSAEAIKIWNMQSGECLNTLGGHLFSVNSVAIRPNGKTIVSGDCYGDIKIWDMQSGACLNTIEKGYSGEEGHLDRVHSVAISPDGKTIVSGSEDNTIKIWDMQSGECLNTLRGHSYGVFSVAISPDGKTIVSGSSDLYEDEEDDEYEDEYEEDDEYEEKYNKKDVTIKIWNLQSGECLSTLWGHSSWVRSVAISSDGKTIVSGSSDDTIKIWDMQSGECIYTIDIEAKVSIDKDGYFVGELADIKEYVRVSEAPLTQRELTDEEIKHFRKKGNFL